MNLTPLRSEMRLLFKHTRFLSVLLVIQFISCFSFISLLIQATVSAQQASKEQIVNSQTTYTVCQNLDDLDFYRFLDDENFLYKQIFAFLQRLCSDKRLNYAIYSPVQVSLENILIPNECYSEPPDSGYDFIFCNSVSSNYFSFFKSKFLDGGSWSEYRNEDSVSTPIVLGYYYHNTFSVGDVITGKLDQSSTNFVVQGILQENTLFDIASSYYSADTYAFIPFSFPKEVTTPSRFDKLCLLNAFSGVIRTSLDRKDFYSVLNNFATETGAPLGNKGIYITDYTNDSINAYIAISGVVLKQYLVLCLICSIFVIISLTATINGMLRETRRIQGILLLVGATIRDIAKCVIGFVFIEALIGDTIFILTSVVLNVNLVSILGAQILVSVIVILFCIFPIITLLREDTFELIGGKE